MVGVKGVVVVACRREVGVVAVVCRREVEVGGVGNPSLEESPRLSTEPVPMAGMSTVGETRVFWCLFASDVGVASKGVVPGVTPGRRI